MVVLDSNLPLSPGVRLTAFLGYVAGTLAYLGWFVIRPLTRRINPYYAARKVEETLDGAKNSVVNWLDLHNDEKLPAAIHNAVGQSAAMDLARVHLDQALSGQRAGWAGGITAVLGVVLLVLLFAQGYEKLFYHLGRTMLPLKELTKPRRTVVTMLA